MKVKIGKFNVDVVDKDCPKRSCYRLGFDKGSYTPGRGYTSYHKDSKGKNIEYPVCMTRHLNGCPCNSICPICRIISVKSSGDKCDRREYKIGLGNIACEGILIKYTI